MIGQSLTVFVCVWCSWVL